MNRIVLTFKRKDLEQKYRIEQTEKGSVRLKYICLTLIFIDFLLLVSDIFIGGEQVRTRQLLGFILTDIIVLYCQKMIKQYSKPKSVKIRDNLNRVPFYLFHILLSCQLTINIYTPNTFEEAKSVIYMAIVIYFISATVIDIWWISFLIQTPATILNSIAILQYLEMEGTSVDIVSSVSIFAFGIMTAYSYISEKQLRESFSNKEELRKEKEKIKDLLDMLPVNIIKINVQNKETQLNQKAKDMLREFGCSFEEFSGRTYLMNRIENSLWQEIVSETNQLERKRKRYERKEEDYMKIADYTSSYLKDTREKIIEFEIQFSQRNSNPDEVLIILQKKNKQRRLKEEKLANIYKSNLILGLSHDLKTPLNGIISLLNAFPVSDRGTKNNYHLINMSAQFLLYKLKDMLDYAQLETGLFLLKEESISLSNLFLSIIQICKLQADLEE